MPSYTKLTNLEVMGEMKAGNFALDIDPDDYEVTKADGTKAAGDAPTKAEFDAVVELCNQLKAKYNALLEKLS